MPYEDPETRFLLTFHPFDNALNKDNDLMMAIITPRAIPVNSFGSGKNINTTYEFYNPLALARQLAFGQLPIRLCYADVVKPSESNYFADAILLFVKTLPLTNRALRCYLSSSEGFS